MYVSAGSVSVVSALLSSISKYIPTYVSAGRVMFDIAELNCIVTYPPTKARRFTSISVNAVFTPPVPNWLFHTWK